MDLGLKGSVIAVTGGASGIGEAITRACLAEGAHVVVLTRPSPEASALAAELHATNASFDLFEAELAHDASCQAAAAHIQTRYGRLDALVNNAGLNDGISLSSGTPQLFLASLRDNLVHYFAMAHYTLPMLRASRGSILNISSKVAITGQGGTSAYAAAKGAQLALTREWAAELLPDNVRVNCIVPAEVLTPQYQTWISQRPDPAAALQSIARRVPLAHRLTQPSEIAAAAVFLLSPTQSAHTTGQHLFVDGGYTHLDRALT